MVVTYIYRTTWEGSSSKAYSLKSCPMGSSSKTHHLLPIWLCTIPSEFLHLPSLRSDKAHLKSFLLDFRFFTIQQALPTGLYYHIVLIVAVFITHLLHKHFSMLLLSMKCPDYHVEVHKLSTLDLFILHCILMLTVSMNNSHCKTTIEENKKKSPIN